MAKPITLLLAVATSVLVVGSFKKRPKREGVHVHGKPYSISRLESEASATISQRLAKRI